MVVPVPRRLPGIGFETVTPPPAEVLPRMDIAAFVGFAASGPLHQPVAVEDAAQFAAIFGEDVPLAWDAQRGERVYAHLGPAVRAFFRNGGRRCWVVRVAGNARVNHFPIPGLLRAYPTGSEGFDVTPAFAPARSEGSWSDPLRVGAVLLSQLVEVLGCSPYERVVDLNLDSLIDVVPGDLLRLTFANGRAVMFLPVETITAAEDLALSSPPSTGSQRGVRVRVKGTAAFWFQASWAAPQTVSSGTADLFSFQGIRATIPVTVPVRIDASSPPHSSLDWPTTAQDPMVKLNLEISPDEAPPPGTLLRVAFAGREFWLLVEELRTTKGEGSPPSDVVQVVGQGLWRLSSPPVTSPVSAIERPDSCERLHLEIEVHRPLGKPERLRDLGFVPEHPRYWNALPTDALLYSEEPDSSRRNLWQAASQPRFSLAGDDTKKAIFLPIAVPLLPGHFLGPERQTECALRRDGLANFHARLFLDPRGEDESPPQAPPLLPLLEASTQTFRSQADFLLYEVPNPTKPTGIYAALGIDEVTLIAVPDVVHNGWDESGERPPPPVQASSPVEHPEWWHFLECNPPEAIPREEYPRWGNFLRCNLPLITAPMLSLDQSPDRAGTFALSWSSQARAKYFLEESLRPDFTGATEVYTGPDTRRLLYGRTPGAYYYRVRAEVEGVSSNYSNGVAVSVAPPGRWLVRPSDGELSRDLLAVQRALLRLCAGRGDLLAVLALPDHYREDQAIRHVAALASSGGPDYAHILPLRFDEMPALSYGALYHPWLIGRDEDQRIDLRRKPPEGAACGVLARRALSRGAWVAPANELLRGTIALTPPMAPARRLDLQEAQINLIRQEPRGFVCLSADTLSQEDDLRPINVRRLLILLRRLALRYGPTYVFEPHDATFRRTVQRGFEGLLNLMFTRGAFAGATPATAYQVRTDTALNTPQSVEQGRFFVELRVAPSQPLRFLTVRLLQTGDRSLVTEER